MYFSFLFRYSAMMTADDAHKNTRLPNAQSVTKFSATYSWMRARCATVYRFPESHKVIKTTLPCQMSFATHKNSFSHWWYAARPNKSTIYRFAKQNKAKHWRTECWMEDERQTAKITYFALQAVSNKRHNNKKKIEMHACVCVCDADRSPPHASHFPAIKRWIPSIFFESIRMRLIKQKHTEVIGIVLGSGCQLFSQPSTRRRRR